MMVTAKLYRVQNATTRTISDCSTTQIPPCAHAEPARRVGQSHVCLLGRSHYTCLVADCCICCRIVGFAALRMEPEEIWRPAENLSAVIPGPPPISGLPEIGIKARAEPVIGLRLAPTCWRPASHLLIEKIPGLLTLWVTFTKCDDSPVD